MGENIACGVVRDIVPRLCQCVTNHHLLSRYTWERNFIYARKKRTALLSTVFTKLSLTRHNCVQISYNEIHPNSGGGHFKIEYKCIYVVK